MGLNHTAKMPGWNSTAASFEFLQNSFFLLNRIETLTLKVFLLNSQKQMILNIRNISMVSQFNDFGSHQWTIFVYLCHIYKIRESRKPKSKPPFDILFDNFGYSGMQVKVIAQVNSLA